MPSFTAMRVWLFQAQSSVRLRVAGLLLLGAIAAACTPKIGDKCQVSTDCSVRGDRLCDISQPNGYCTQLNCQGQSCPVDEASCVLFESAVPGCGYDDRSGPFGSRVARSFCMANCETNGDCRDGYVCADPRSFPWNAVILDNDQTKRTCLATPLEGQDAGTIVAPMASNAALVCGPNAPTVTAIDAGPPRIHDAGLTPTPLFDAGGAGDAGAPKDAAADGG